MRLDFIKYSPTRNTTILVLTPVPIGDMADIAARLMDAESVCAEQTGFLMPPSRPGADAALRMMGGEFCGNATMSLGAYLAERSELKAGASANYALEISGVDGLVRCRIDCLDPADYFGRVSMPLPRAVETVCLCGKSFPLVRFDGIAHALIDDADVGMDALRSALPRWCEALGADACGAMLCDKDFGRIEPLVYVPSTGSIVAEHGCGSGTAAVGAYLALRHGAIERDIHQPGGRMTVTARSSGGSVTAIEIGGHVRPVVRGTAYI